MASGAGVGCSYRWLAPPAPGSDGLGRGLRKPGLPVSCIVLAQLLCSASESCAGIVSGGACLMCGCSRAPLEAPFRGYEFCGLCVPSNARQGTAYLTTETRHLDRLGQGTVWAGCLPQEPARVVQW